jgi:hypothetical protein
MRYRPHYESLTEPVSVGSAERPGEYPPDGELVTVGGVELPHGRARFFTHHDGTPTDIRLGWETTEAVDGAYRTWLALVRVFSQTGLWPVVGRLGYGTARPWEQHHRWKPEPTAERPNTIERVLAEAWDGQALCDARTGARLPETRPPIGGLAPGSVGSGVDLFPSTDAWWYRPGVITLVAVEHPWEAPAVGGWDLALNQSLLGADFSAVVKSWQERFGAYMPAADELVVTRPPQSSGQAMRLAEEHRLVCPYDSQFHDPDERPGEYAHGLVGSTRWGFWWD